jgi:UDP-N-acetylglucosamine 3-dehydrogenase
MGRHHARNYAEAAGADLCAVVDADAGRAEELAARYGCPAFASLDELLDSGVGFEAASVVVPTVLHLDVASRLLRAGKHVLVEKPITATVEEADELVALAGTAGLVLAVGHVERFNPAVRELRRQIESGDMGDVLSLVARRVGVMPPQVQDANVIVDLAIHDIDVFRYLLDVDAPDEVHCNAGRAIIADRFDFADVFLRFGDVACFLQVNWVTPVKIRSLAVTGTRAYAEVEYVTQRLRLHRAQHVREPDSFAELEALSEREPDEPELERAEPLARQLEEFLRAVRGLPAEIVSGHEGARSMAVAERVVAEAERSYARGGA